MNILICPDKFKLTFSASQIADFIKQVIAERFKAETETVLLSDGGEGFLDALADRADFQKILSKTFDPLFRQIDSYFLFEQQHKAAYLELALTGSLGLLAPDERNPCNTSSFGLGCQLMDAMELGAKQLYVGLGGSSTTDLGMGMAAALGYKFYDSNGKLLAPVGRNMIKVSKVVVPKNKPWKNVQVYACTDVENPLYGTDGAAYVYAKQKGATIEQVKTLDRGLRHLSEIIEQTTGRKIANLRGAGAAGGLGAGLVGFTDAQIISGAEFVFDKILLEEKIIKADFVITGEGKFDSQTKSGKLVWKVVELARKHNKPVLIVAGVANDLDLPSDVSLITAFAKPVDIQIAKKFTKQKLREKLEKYFCEKFPGTCI